jgi:hypothetical protein
MGAPLGAGGARRAMKVYPVELRSICSTGLRLGLRLRLRDPYLEFFFENSFSLRSNAKASLKSATTATASSRFAVHSSKKQWWQKPTDPFRFGEKSRPPSLLHRSVGQ